MSVETHGLKFVVDTKEVAKGFADYRSAVEGIFASLDKFEAHVAKTMKGVANAASNKSDINAFVKAFDKLADIKVDGKAAPKISALAAAMGTFKAPSAAQIANTRKFFGALAGFPDLGAAFRTIRSIDDLNIAMNGFKAPPVSQAKRLKDFGRALQEASPAFRSLKNVTGISGVANELATISHAINGLKVPSKSHIANLAGMANALRQFNFSNLAGATGLYSFVAAVSRFRAPSAGQIKNLQNFITTVSNLQIPRNGSQIARVLQQIAQAANVASGSLGGLRGHLGSFNWRSFNHGAGQARLQMMGLQNAFSGTFQIGSALRSLLGSLTIAELGRNYFEASNKALQFNAAMKVINPSQKAVAEQMNYLRDTANAFGQDLLGASEGYMKFAISANKAGATVAQTRDIYEGMSSAMLVLGTSADRQKDVFLALQQVMNKGYLGSEELMQQLNEQMPGAIGYLREETERLGTDLQDALEKKMLNGTQALLYLAKRYREDFGPSVEEALKRPNAQMQILRNNINTLFQRIGENGGDAGFGDALARINSYLTPQNVEKFAKAVGEGLAKATERAADAAEWLYENWDRIKGPLGTGLSLLGKYMIVTGAFQIGQALVSPLISAAGAAKTLIPHLRQTWLLMQAINATNMMGPPSQLAAMTPAFQKFYAQLLSIRTAMAGLTLRGGMGAVLKGMRAGFASLTTPIAGVGAAVGLVSTAAIGLGAAFASGTKAARDSGIELRSDQYTTAEIISGMWLTTMEKLGKLWDGVTRWIGEGITKAGNVISSVMKKIAEWGAEGALALTYGFNKAVEVIARLFIALGKSVGNTLNNIVGVGSKLLSGDFAGAGKNALALLTAEGVRDGFADAFGNFRFDGADYNKFKTRVGVGFASTFDGLFAEMGAKGRANAQAQIEAQQKTLQTGVSDAERKFRELDSGYDPNKLLQEPKEKAKKPKTAEQLYREEERRLNKIAALADSVMRRFAEDDPLAKVTQDFVTDLTEQAQALLKNDAYKKWLSNIQADAKDGRVSVDSLTAALKGNGLETEVLENLQQRYGISLQDITNLLQSQEKAYERNLKLKKQERTFGFEALKSEREAMNLAAMGNRERTVTEKLLRIVNEAIEKKIEFTERDIEVTRRQLEAIYAQNRAYELQRELLENNGIRSYIQDTMTLHDAVNNMDRNALRNVEETLFRLGTTGKLSFKSLIDGMQQDIIRFASQNLTKGFMNLLIPGASQDVADGKNPSIFGGLFKAMGFGDIGQPVEDRMKTLGLEGNPMFVHVVNADGTLSIASALGRGSAPKIPGENVYQDNLGDMIFNNDITQTMGENVAGSVNDGIGASSDYLKKSFCGTFDDVAVYGKDVLKSVFTGLGGAMGGGGGGFFGSLLNLGLSAIGGFGGGGGLQPGDITSMIAANPGVFKEGGYPGSPVSRTSMPASAFVNAPHYAQGTHNTSGIPAVLHENEAVIPLTRGRKVPVTLTNGDSNANTKVINNNFNITTPNADSFRKSKQQIAVEMHRSANIAFQRNT